MKKNNLLNIIKEEISGFDYLNNDKRLEERESIDLLKNFDFQKQFIIDCIEGNQKIRKFVADDNLSSYYYQSNDIVNDEKINFDITNDYEYKYDSQKIPTVFKINFKASNVKILDGKLDTKEDIQKIDWLDISVNMISRNGDKIDFVAYDKANNKIKALFIKKSILDNIINDYSNGN